MSHPKLGPAPVQSTMLRLYGLDFLRAGAALLVAFHHYWSTPTAHDRLSLAFGERYVFHDPLNAVGTLGILGVEAFFVISGFVIVMSAEGRSVREFLASRAARLLPAFWFCCCLTWGVLALTPNYRQVSLTQLAANLLMVARPLHFEFVDGVYWSLVVEVRFYLLIALVLWLGQMARVHLLLAAWLLIAAVDAWTGIHPVVRFILLPQFAPAFIAGGALYLKWRKRSGMLANFLLAGSCFLLAQAGFQKVSGMRPDLGIQAAALLLAFVCAVWVFSCTGLSSIRGAWMASVGTLTYPLYLVHNALGILFMRLYPWRWPYSAVMVTLMALAMSIAIAYLVVRFIEPPLSRQVRKFISPLKSPKNLLQ